MANCPRICTILMAVTWLSTGAVASAQVCLYADFDSDGDPWTVETLTMENSGVVHLILEVPPSPPLGEEFLITVEEGCCEDWQMHGHYGVTTDYESITFDAALVDSFYIELHTCLYCCPWHIYGRFSDTAAMTPGERYFIGQLEASSYCAGSPPLPCFRPCTMDLDFHLFEGGQCQDSSTMMEFWCEWNPVAEETWGSLKALYR